MIYLSMQLIDMPFSLLYFLVISMGLRAIETKTKGPEAKLFEDLSPSQTTVLQSQTKATPVNFPILLPG